LIAFGFASPFVDEDLEHSDPISYLPELEGIKAALSGSQGGKQLSSRL
jgi:hypothetical protein